MSAADRHRKREAALYNSVLRLEQQAIAHLRKVWRELSKARGLYSQEVVQALTEILGSADELTLTPTALAGLLKEQLGWERLSTKRLAALLHPTGLHSKKKWLPGGKVIRAYHLRKSELGALPKAGLPQWFLDA